MSVSQMDSDGFYKINFNVPMMSPKDGVVKDNKIYGSTFDFVVASDIDGSKVYGKFK